MVIIGFFGTENLKLVELLTPTSFIWEWLPFTQVILLYFFVLFSLQLSDSFALLPASEDGPLWAIFSSLCGITWGLFSYGLLAISAFLFVSNSGLTGLVIVAGWYILLCLFGWVVMTNR